MKYFNKYICFFIIALVNFSHPSFGTDTLKVQLKWKHQFQFAGYYAALEKGYYLEYGLQVELLEATTGEEAIPAVIEGAANFGIATSDLLLARNENKKVVILANIFQHSPYVFLTLKHDDGDNIHDLAGKDIMLEEHAAELLAYLKSEQIPTTDINFEPHTFSPEDLIKNDVYAMSGYITDEPYLLANSNIDYNVFNPRSGGIDFYGDVLFTSENEIRNNPERVQHFIDATLKGWKYALENENEIIDLIYNKYSKRHTKEHLKYEAEQTKRLVMSDVIEIGYINKNRWQRIGEIYSELNMLPADFSLNGFIYERNSNSLLRLFLIAGLIITVILLITAFIILRFYKLNQALRAEGRIVKESQKKLVLLEERYRKLSENAPFPILITAPKTGNVLYLNEQASDKFEINREFALQKKSTSFYVNPADRENIIEKINTHGFLKKTEVEMKTVSGKVFWAHISSNYTTFDNRDAVFSAIVDISDRIKLEKNLIAANATKDKFFSIIAHDLKGPIGGLNSFLEILVENKNSFTPEKLDTVLNLLRETSQSTYELLENLLLWAQTEKGEIQFNPQKNNIYTLFKSNIQLFSTILNNKHLKIINNCEPDNYLTFDFDMMNSVIRNLLNNAIKYSKQNGEIVINCYKKNQFNEFEIVDSGVGVEKNLQKNIFSLEREKRSTIGTDGEKGTGIGLVLCYEFIKKHKGEIFVKSQPNKGSTFTFRIPN